MRKNLADEKMSAGENKNGELQNSSKLLLRHIEKLGCPSLLVSGAPDDDFGVYLKRSSIAGDTFFHYFDFHLFKRQKERLQSAGMANDSVNFTAWYSPPAALHDAAVIFLPKSRSLIEYTLRMAAGSVKKDGTVFLVGENNAGIRSGRYILRDFIGEVFWSDAAKHCVVYASKNEKSFSETAAPVDFLESYELEIAGEKLVVKSLPGVFSHGRLDVGTSFLLENLPKAVGGSVLDFGCGSGIIGLVLKKSFPEIRLDALDSNVLAIESTRLTTAANNITEADVFPSNGFSEVKRLYDFIFSNPPFHAGVQTDYRVVESLFAEASRYLAPEGKLIIVANRFLKYFPLLEKHFSASRILSENKGFRVYEAQKSAR